MRVSCFEVACPRSDDDTSVDDRRVVDGDRLCRREGAGDAGGQAERAAVLGTLEFEFVAPDLAVGQ